MEILPTGCRRPTTVAAVLVTVIAAWSSNARHADAQFWKRILPASHTVAAPQAGSTLTEENGPWLIIAASFRGDDAEQQASQLAEEFRRRHKLTAYIHDRAFDFSEQNPGRGLDSYGGPIRRRYQTEEAREFAVLVGDFPSIDDPEAQQTLERIKTMPATALQADDDDSASAASQFRQFSNALLGRNEENRQRGPLAKAFLTRNPLLPREYFVPKGVDDFVAKMNQGVEHSLLECPGKYSVQVATFRGKTVLQTEDAKKNDAGGFSWGFGKEKSDPLVEAAENAHLLTAELRANGWDAYEYHDRKESIVAIGSFDQVAQRLPDGRVAPTPQVQKIVQTFGAAYNTPADPLTGDDVRSQRRATELKQQFNQMLTNNHGQFTATLNPKHVKVMRRKKVERIIPIDIYPHAIEVPRRSISSAYAGW
jgi:hypothetical protein